MMARPVLDDGKAVEVATVGREGVVGAMAVLGLYKSSVRVVVQLRMAATIIAASQFRKAVDNSAVVRDLCIRYNEVSLHQARDLPQAPGLDLLARPDKMLQPQRPARLSVY
jgi:hypothetical protein